MTVATDITPTDATTTTQFSSHLLQLVGEPFLFALRSYGDELVLHFGERLQGPPRKTKHGEFRYEHGSYSLFLRGSSWVLKSGVRSAVFSGGLEADIRKTLGEPSHPVNVVNESPIAVGARVTALLLFQVVRPGVDGVGLRVELSDGSTVIVIPTPDEPEPTEAIPDDATVSEVADWELKSPHGTLQVGPGKRWHFEPTK